MLIRLLFIFIISLGGLLGGYHIYEYSEALKRIERSKDSTIVKQQLIIDSLKQKQ